MIGIAALWGALGLSPFLALAGLGLLDALEVWTLPSGLSAFGHPLLVALNGLIAFALHSGRSSKLTKPLAEIAGLGESAFALVVAGAAAAPVFAESALTGSLFMVVSVAAVASLIALRTASDVLVWLSPFPFVDGAFQTAKAGALGLLITAAVLSPPVAVALTVLGAVGAGWVLSWTYRSLRFGLTLLGDLTWARSKALSSVPRDEVIDGDLGPFEGFIVRRPGSTRHAPAKVELRAGRWFLLGAGRSTDPGQDAPLGDGYQSELRSTWAGLELEVGDAVILLPPRYRGVAEQIRAESRPPAEAAATATAKAVRVEARRTPRAEPSAL